MSSGGLQFGILEIISSFGNVWADQSYWQVTPTFPIRSGCLQGSTGTVSEAGLCESARAEAHMG